MNIAVIGLWQLGETYSVCLAELGHTVVGIDDNEGAIKNLAVGIPPLAEPGLEALLSKNLAAQKLRYSTDFSEIKKCDIVWFTFDTPVDDHDDVQMGSIYDALEKTTPHLLEDVTVVMTSQVPVGTSEKILAAIHAKRPEVEVHYVYTPENLRLGEAVRCFMEPGRIVIGASDDIGRETVEKIFSPLHAEIVAMSVPSAEMAKHALNAFLATSLSFINDIADVCEAKGADVLDVARALRSDPRIGKGAFLGAGLGFSGGTLGRDLRALEAAAQEDGIAVPVITSAWEKNANREKELVERFIKALGGVEGKKVAVFGVTYKAGTTTLRRSRSIELAEHLHREGAIIVLHDPHAMAAEVAGVTTMPFLSDPYEAAKGCDGIIMATPWPDFKELDFGRLAKVCHADALVFDSNNFLYNEGEGKIKSAGLKYKGVGRKS